ncbi:MAG: YegP family protein [Candidatus Thiodubiliella endoseptemdiera]|uniref:YegP family protein n=1 Tax=Candidatus Thiodubiliella endoseptemdiera TaxID=2738886 RepID=A0A853F824_9GAMM|nr:YegP family protein [Candidatus Thiodubiliella endoseptemdiera]
MDLSIFKVRKDGEWYWRLKAGNNEPMAIGGQGFSSKQSILGSIENVKVEIGRAEIIFENPEDDPAYEAKTKTIQKKIHLFLQVHNFSKMDDNLKDLLKKCN